MTTLIRSYPAEDDDYLINHSKGMILLDTGILGRHELAVPGIAWHMINDQKRSNKAAWEIFKS